MRRSKERFKHESLHDAKSVQQILKAVTKGVAKGRLTFADEDGEIVMQPEGLLSLKVTATQDDTRNRVNIRISWQTDDSDKPRKSLKVE
jgi:amphi-Trp domain-containing protein